MHFEEVWGFNNVEYKLFKNHYPVNSNIIICKVIPVLVFIMNLKLSKRFLCLHALAY